MVWTPKTKAKRNLLNDFIWQKSTFRFSISIAIGEKTKRALLSKYWILMLRRVQCKYLWTKTKYFKHWKILTSTKIYLCSFLCEWIEFKKTATHFKSKFQFSSLNYSMCILWDKEYLNHVLQSEILKIIGLGFFH